MFSFICADIWFSRIHQRWGKKGQIWTQKNRKKQIELIAVANYRTFCPWAVYDFFFHKTQCKFKTKYVWFRLCSTYYIWRLDEKNTPISFPKEEENPKMKWSFHETFAFAINRVESPFMILHGFILHYWLIHALSPEKNLIYWGNFQFYLVHRFIICPFKILRAFVSL